MANDNKATFSINLEGNAPEVSKEMAETLDRLRQQIQGSTDRMGAMGKALRGLKGNSEEVTAAKSLLKAKIDAEKDSISAANLAILKHGQVLGAMKKPAMDAAKASGDITKGSDRLLKSIKAVGGPVDDAIGGFDKLKGVLGGASSGMSALAIGAAAAIAGVVALGAALVAGAVSLSKWIVEAGNAGRNAGLLREAFAGSAENGDRLGTQVDALARRIPTAKDEINKMATALMRTRLSGSQIVDTMNIVGQASAAMGDDVGNALGDIVKRGALMQRMQLNPQELFGNGNVKFDDVAGRYANLMHIGLQKAKDQLYQGTADLTKGAQALREAVDARFGAINAKKLISIEGITTKLHDSFTKLTSGVNMERILGPLAEMAGFFDTSTFTGKTLQGIITSIGNILGTTLGGNVSVAQDLFEKVELGFIKFLIGAIKTKRALDPVIDVLWAVEKAVFRVQGAFMGVVGKVWDAVSAVRSLSGAAGASIGKTLGIGVGAAPTPGAVGAAETQAGPPSPAVGVAEAHADGGMVMQPAPGEAFASVAPGEFIMPKGAAPASGGKGGSSKIEITFNISGGGSAKETAHALQSPDFLAQITKAIEDANRSIGIPTQAEAAP